jgi:hypothetical protein
MAGTTWRASLEGSPAGYVLVGQQMEQDYGVCPDIMRLVASATNGVAPRDDRRATTRRADIGKQAAPVMASGGMGLRRQSAR